MSTHLRLFCALLLVLQTSTSSATMGQQEAATTTAGFVLEDGTPVKLRISQTVSSADAHVNDKVEFEVLEDVTIHDVVVIPKGGIAWGTVTEAQPKRRMARGGKLEIVMDSVRLVDGQKAALRAVKEGKGGGHVGGMTIGIVAAAIVFWPAAPLFLLMHGHDITFPKGTDVPTFINGNMNLDEAKFRPPTGGPAHPEIASTSTSVAISSTPATDNSLSTAQSLAPTSQAQPLSVPSTVTVKSTPPGADIFVDDDFAGDTPSTLNISVGKHIVRVRKPGFQEWVRTINLYGGSVTLNAELANSTDEIHAATTAMVDSSTKSLTTGVSTNSSQNSIGWIGVHAQNKGDVAVVTSVAADGPAAQAGIQVGDIILALDGRLIKGRDFESGVAALKPGTQISLNYAHGASAREVSVTVGSHNM